MQVLPVVLEGEQVRLEPFTLDYIEPLWEITKDIESWRYLPIDPKSKDDIHELLEGAIALAAVQQGLGFCTFTKKPDQMVGFTGYWNLAPEHLRLEIGMTWLHPDRRRSFVNTEAKFLMTQHAFEELGCERVEFKTDARNSTSRAALRRIGAVEEGILRNHMQYPNGTRRDTVYFSFIRSDWPQIKQHFQKLMSHEGTSE